MLFPELYPAPEPPKSDKWKCKAWVDLHGREKNADQFKHKKEKGQEKFSFTGISSLALIDLNIVQTKWI
jgi:hypothetical protein